MNLLSKHPYPPFIPEIAKKLIIGTIPPPRFCKEESKLFDEDVNFYYGSRDNYFWLLLGEVFNISFKYTNNEVAIDQRKELLKSLNIGITDIIDTCYHENCQATDDKLKDIKHKDLKKLLIDFPKIDTFIYTSEFVKKQMNNYLKTYHSINPQNQKEQSVKIDGKEYRVIILYSPSPQALINMGENGVEKRKEQYRKVFGNIS